MKKGCHSSRGCVYIFTTFSLLFSNPFFCSPQLFPLTTQYGQQDVDVIVLGNKCDLEESRVVTEHKGQTLAAEYGAEFFETSAKSGQNVEETILTLARAVKHKVDKKDVSRKVEGGCTEVRWRIVIQSEMTSHIIQKLC